MAKRTCMEAALSKLNYRMRAIKELERSLKDLGYEAGNINETIDELLSFGYLDDHRFSMEFFRSCRLKNWSRQRIVRALKEKGVGSDVISSALSELEDSGDLEDAGLTMDDRETALKEGLRMVRSQLRGSRPVDDKFLRKVGRKLQSLGYDSGCCYYVIGRLRDRSYENDEEDFL